MLPSSMTDPCFTLTFKKNTEERKSIKQTAVEDYNNLHFRFFSEVFIEHEKLKYNKVRAKKKAFLTITWN